MAVSAADSSTALLKLHSDLAIPHLLFLAWNNDAQFGPAPQPPFDRD
ncbi:hypothetical protein ACVWZL_008534 [Bradyrhizobium sp. GM2.4]